MSTYFFRLINIFYFLAEQWQNTPNNSYQSLTISITKMLLGKGNQVKSLGLKAIPSSMSLMPKSPGQGLLFWLERSHTESRPQWLYCSVSLKNSCWNQSSWVLLLWHDSFPQLCEGLLLHCVPQSSEENAQIKPVAASTSPSQPLTRW